MQCTLCLHERNLFPLWITKKDGESRTHVRICDVCMEQMELCPKELKDEFTIENMNKLLINAVKDDIKMKNYAKNIIGLHIGLENQTQDRKYGIKRAL